MLSILETRRIYKRDLKYLKLRILLHQDNLLKLSVIVKKLHKLLHELLPHASGYLLQMKK
jgi:hypothetical protein